MSARIQGLAFAVSTSKQAAINSAAASYMRMTKVNATLSKNNMTTETNARWIGKGSEFATQTFPTAWDVKGQIEKYATSDFFAFCAAYGLGAGAGPYTPLNHAQTLQLPFFTVVEQLPEGGGFAIDNAYLGCCLEDFTYAFASGPGLANSKLTANWIGSGIETTPSGIVVPTLAAENILPQSSLSLVINGTDYVSNKNIISGSFSWKNNLMVRDGYFPGSGTQTGAAVMGRLEIGDRVATLQFVARLDSASTELAKLKAQTAGTAVLGLTFDPNNTATVTFQRVTFEMVDNGEHDGLACVTVTCTVQEDPTNGVISIDVSNPLGAMAQ